MKNVQYNYDVFLCFCSLISFNLSSFQQYQIIIDSEFRTVQFREGEEKQNTNNVTTDRIAHFKFSLPLVPFPYDFTPILDVSRGDHSYYCVCWNFPSHIRTHSFYIITLFDIDMVIYVYEQLPPKLTKMKCKFTYTSKLIHNI